VNEDEQLAGFLNGLLQGRAQTAQEIARAALFLLLGAIQRDDRPVPSTSMAAWRSTNKTPNQRISFLQTNPPFITNFTFSSSLIFFSGIAADATMSAHLPASMVPAMSPQPRSSAGTEVPLESPAVGSYRIARSIRIPCLVEHLPIKAAGVRAQRDFHALS